MSQAISSTSSINSLSLAPRFLSINLSRHQRFNSKILCVLNRGASFEHNSNGKLVDEDMIVLRMRIREIKMSEDAHDDMAPSDWMEWEKKYYVENYDSDICEAVGFLQSQLMSTRPSLALAMFGLISLSLPISMGVMLLHLVDVAKEVVLGFHF